MSKNKVVKIKWLQQDIEYLRNNKDRNSEDIAQELGRTVTSVRRMLTRLKLRKLIPRNLLTLKEQQYIIDNFQLKNSHAIGKDLNRSSQCIKNFATKLKLNIMTPSVKSFRGTNVGDKFNKLTILEFCNGKKNIVSTRVKCECNTIKVIRLSHLLDGSTQSCGCATKEYLRCRPPKATLPNYNRIKNIFNGMKKRCLNKNDTNYHRYGGRGITICNEWINNINNFYNWAMNNGYEPHLTLDRIDNNGNYEPNNCRWATIDEQLRNTSRNRHIEIDGITKTLAEWSRDEMCQTSLASLRNRLKKGMNPKEALITPLREMKIEAREKVFNTKYEAFGIIKTLKEWLSDTRCEVDIVLIKDRLRKQWTFERAISQKREKPLDHIYGVFKLTHINGETKTLSEWGKDSTIKRTEREIFNRVVNGFPWY